MASILEEQQRRLARQRPLFERVQESLSRMEIGAGVHWFRVGMFGLLTLGLIVFYTGTQFYGLRDAEAMNLGQLGRNLAFGRGYVTQTVRPLDLFYLVARGRPALSGDQVSVPEMWTPPGYPLVLSLAFRVASPVATSLEGLGFLRGDRVVMITAWTWFVVGLVLMYWLGHLLFDRRVAVLAAFLYVFCNPLLDHAIAGLPTSFLAVLLLVTVAGILQAQRWQAAGRSGWWVNGALVVSAVALAAGVLTEYALSMLVLVWLVYVGVTFRGREGGRKVVLGGGIVVLALAPLLWRNYRVTGSPFGLARYGLLEGTGQGTERVVRPGQMQRTFAAPKPVGARVLLRKAVMNGRELYETTVKDVGANYLMVFFLVALLHRFRRPEVLQARRLVWWGLVGFGAWVCVAGPPRREALTIFAPLVMLYGAAFFYVMFERLQFRTRARRSGTIGLFVALNLVPFTLAILPPRDTVAYPPYDAQVASNFGRWFRPNEVVASDIPWAVAWYGDRTAIWAPLEQRDYMQINDNVHTIAGVYVTQATLQGQTVMEMFGGYQQLWWRLFLFQTPPDFPLRQFRALTPDGQQVLISNRPL